MVSLFFAWSLELEVYQLYYLFKQTLLGFRFFSVTCFLFPSFLPLSLLFHSSTYFVLSIVFFFQPSDTNFWTIKVKLLFFTHKHKHQNYKFLSKEHISCMLQIVICFAFVIHYKIFYNFPCDFFSVTHGLFSRVFLNFQVLWDFPGYFCLFLI